MALNRECTSANYNTLKIGITR